MTTLPQGSPDEELPAPERLWAKRLIGLLRRLSRWTLELLLVACVVMAIGALRGGPPLTGVAPEIAAVALDGQSVSLKSLRGAPTILYFHASWCTACSMTTGTLERFARQHPNVHVLGIAMEPADDARREPKRSFAVVAETEAIARDYKVNALPTTVVVDAEGKVAWARQGVLVPWELELHLP